MPEDSKGSNQFNRAKSSAVRAIMTHVNAPAANSQRSHAGRLVLESNKEALPALAAATG
jgi:hypothetical protein